MGRREAAVVVAGLLCMALAQAAAAAGRKVGGRTAVKNVEGNEEVQRLGGFAVEEYNRRLRGSGEPVLRFAAVVAAARQVVAGIMYHLRVAVEGEGDGRYDAVVVVRPWEGRRELVSFAPAFTH